MKSKRKPAIKRTPKRSSKHSSNKIPSILWLILAFLVILGIYWYTNRSSLKETTPTEQVSTSPKRPSKTSPKPASKEKSSATTNSKNASSKGGNTSSTEDYGEAEDLFALEIPILKSDASEELIPHLGYTVSFNAETRLPNWVAWALSSAETQGNVPRGNHFKADPDVRGTQADNEDYRRTGWDRGHMAPAGDMKWGEQSMRESFYFSNICPQNRNLNRGDWKALEEQSRCWAQKYGNVYIACGPIVGKARHGKIGKNRVVVPDAFYKVLLIEHRGQYEAIGFVFNNEAGHRKLTSYIQTVDQVEAMTDIDFFPQLPDPIEQQVEAKVNPRIWQLN